MEKKILGEWQTTSMVNIHTHHSNFLIQVYSMLFLGLLLVFQANLVEAQSSPKETITRGSTLSKKTLDAEIAKLIKAACPSYMIEGNPCPSRCVNTKLLKLMAESPRRINSKQFLSFMDDCSNYSPGQALARKKKEQEIINSFKKIPPTNSTLDSKTLSNKLASTTKPTSLTNRVKPQSSKKTIQNKPKVTKKTQVLAKASNSTPAPKIKKVVKKKVAKVKPKRSQKPKISAAKNSTAKKKLARKAPPAPQYDSPPARIKKTRTTQQVQKTPAPIAPPKVTSPRTTVNCSKASEYRKALQISKMKNREYKKQNLKKKFESESKFASRLELKLKELSKTCAEKSTSGRVKKKYQ